MEIILNHLWELIIASSGVILVFIFKQVWSWITDYLVLHNHERILKTLEDIVELSVEDINEIAEAYKKASEDGKLTEDEKVELHALAKNKIWEMFPNIKLAILNNYFGKDLIHDFVDKMIKKTVTAKNKKK